MQPKQPTSIAEEYIFIPDCSMVGSQKGDWDGEFVGVKGKSVCVCGKHKSKYMANRRVSVRSHEHVSEHKEGRNQD